MEPNGPISDCQLFSWPGTNAVTAFVLKTIKFDKKIFGQFP